VTRSPSIGFFVMRKVPKSLIRRPLLKNYTCAVILVHPCTCHLIMLYRGLALHLILYELIVSTTATCYGAKFRVITCSCQVGGLRLLRDVPEKNLLRMTLHTPQPIPKFLRPTIRFSFRFNFLDAQNGPVGAPNRD